MIVELRNITKTYNNNIIFNQLSMEIEKNEFVVIMGKSGSGKSTLLNIIGLLDKPDCGDVKLFDEDNIKPFSKKAERILREKIGYLFQNFALLDNENVEYNLKMALENVKGNKKELITRVLEKVGLKDYEKKKVCECSGGEQQRVAIARLLLKPCELILADEPTGSLDSYNRELVCDLLKRMQKEGKTIIVVTHDDYLKQYADRVIIL
ncbi:MAG: ABC transporter ATP-binding protein [Coprobacillus sp.]|nr:ABC transporter ATP-binding protein [Coprobacillus sp.]